MVAGAVIRDMENMIPLCYLKRGMSSASGVMGIVRMLMRQGKRVTSAGIQSQQTSKRSLKNPITIP